MDYLDKMKRAVRMKHFHVNRTNIRKIHLNCTHTVCWQYFFWNANNIFEKICLSCTNTGNT